MWWQSGVRTNCEADAGHVVKPKYPDSPNRLQNSPFLGVASLGFSLFTFLQGDCTSPFPGNFWPMGPPGQMWIVSAGLKTQQQI